jgi:hypothetical protein
LRNSEQHLPLFAVRKNLQTEQFSIAAAVLSLPLSCKLLHIASSAIGGAAANPLISQV